MNPPMPPSDSSGIVPPTLDEAMAWLEACANAVQMGVAKPIDVERLRTLRQHLSTLYGASRGIVPDENEDRRAAEIRDLITKATKTIAVMCNGGRWTMSVPARLNEDPDLIFGRLCSEATSLLDETATLRARLASSEEERDGYKAKWEEKYRFALELVERVAELEAAMQKVYDEAERQVFRGKPHTYTTSSEPIGVRGGQITTRIGDLCDFRHAIQLIALRHGAKHPPRVESSRDATAPETPNTWYCVECGPDAQFTSAGAMHFDAYGHTPHRIGSPVATAPETDNG